MVVEITLSQTLKELEERGKNLTKNAIAVEAKVRPSTLSDLAKGDSKAIKFETLNDILNAMNRLMPDENFDIGHIIKYKEDIEPQLRIYFSE
ncbi:helix-turn-helix domain-containing protein [Caryophanon tenue]|uniref:HTH cro/C1-type domain-containing protein n=1 Tax=Caryophanon tenue TaxID=33978 RepID=A0A1C0Y546_9BACL|nr:hypothetical protein [Caryophanon tenue]OCS82256.1 hypothetical protein A6M13_07420 [Caryophanon tenue]